MRSWFLLMMQKLGVLLQEKCLMGFCCLAGFLGEGCGLLFFGAVSQVGKAGHKLGVQLKMTLNSCSRVL